MARNKRKGQKKPNASNPESSDPPQKDTQNVEPIVSKKRKKREGSTLSLSKQQQSKEAAKVSKETTTKVAEASQKPEPQQNSPIAKRRKTEASSTPKTKKEGKEKAKDSDRCLIAFHEQHRPWGFLHSLSKHPQIPLVSAIESITVEEGLPTVLLNRDQLSAVVVSGDPSHFSVTSPPDSSRTSPSPSDVTLLKDGDTLTFENGKKKANFVFFLLGFPSLPSFLEGVPPSFLDNVPPSLLSQGDSYYDDDEDDSGSDGDSAFGYDFPEGMKKREREREREREKRSMSRATTPTRNASEGSGALQRGKAITLDESREHDLWKQEIEDDQDKQKSAASPKHASTPRQLPRMLEKMMRRGGRVGDRNWKKMGKLLKSGVNGSKQKGKNTSFEEIVRYLRLPPQHEVIEKFFLSYFEKRIHCPSKDKIAFSNFPFTVPISLQHSLISSSFLHLHGTGFPASLPTSLPPSILLVGPPGSHTMEELLVRALASELDADLMVFDDRGIVGGEVHDMCLVCSSPCCLKAPCCFRFPSEEKSGDEAPVAGMVDSSGEESDVGDALGIVENQDGSITLTRNVDGQKQDVVTKFKIGDRVSVATGPVPPFLTMNDQPRATATVIGIVTPIISQPHYRLLYDDSVAQGERMEREEGEWEDEDDEDDEDEDDENAPVTIRVKTISKSNEEDTEDGAEGTTKSEMHKQKVKKMMKLVEIDPEDHLTLERSAQEENITLAALTAYCEIAQKRAQERPVIAFFRDVDAAIDNPKRKEIVKKMCDNAGKGRLVCIGGFIRDDSHKAEGHSCGGGAFFGFGGRGGGGPPKDEESDDLSALTGLIDVFRNPIIIPENSEMYGEGWSKWSSFLEKEKKKVKLEMNLIGLKRVMASVPIRLRMEGMEGIASLLKKDGEDNAGHLSSLLQSDKQMLENLASNRTIDFCFSHPSLKERDFDHQALSQICAYSLSRIAMRSAKLGESRWWDSVAKDEKKDKGEEEKKQAEKSGEKPKQDDKEKEECEIDERSLRYGINLFCRQNPQKKTLLGQKLKTLNLDPYERRIAKEVVEPGAIGVRWENIGALNKAKRLLREVVLLPLQRPELFRTGCLSKPCKGVLLFGPPGTGKTMLAKAVATACGAHFLNLTSAILFDKYYGEAEKYHRAVFTLASKLAPCVIFIDEIDSILGKRGEGEHEATRKCKNEFMTLWDGLTSKEYERVLVLGATNRPFDLDEAVLRRMPRRVLVDLPDLSNRVQILKIQLNDETISKDLDLKAIAEKTDGFSGSDLRQLCVAAAYIRLRDFIRSEEKEQENEDESKGKEGEKKPGETQDNDSMMGLLTESFAENEGNDVIEILEKEVKEPELRPLLFSDFEKALKDVKSSVSEEGESLQQLRQWDREYGTGSESSRSFHSIYL